jgi:hypothetical protein
MELTAGKIYTFDVEDKTGSAATKDSKSTMISTKRPLKFIQYDGNTAIFDDMSGRAIGYATAAMKNVTEVKNGGRRRKTRARKHKRVSRKTRRSRK